MHEPQKNAPEMVPVNSASPSVHRSARIAYADCFAGVSGDMFLGALIHAGVDQELLRSELTKLDIGPFKFSIESKILCSINCLHVDVDNEPRPEFRHLSAILTLLDRSGLPAQVTEKSATVFRELAIAEARVHGIPLEQVHFHEIGAVDTIIDVVGTILGLHMLDIKRLVASPVPVGRGLVACAHGTLPLPAPAVCELLRGIPVYGVPIEQELVTPTGAALLKVLVDHFGPMEPMTIEMTGYGAGTHILPNHLPNLFRLIIGHANTVRESQEVEIIETNLDDWNSEGFPYICDLLLERGALDVSLAPLLMKKGRPGFRLQVICSPVHGNLLKETILSETSAIGLRFRREQRHTLVREHVFVDTIWGKIQAKKVWTPSGILIYPEYEACREIAARHHVPLQQVYREVSRAKEEPDRP
jgi:pyridinium-3,5-bisthiocarboxylic acid mononucleotide nickel chelatase